MYYSFDIENPKDGAFIPDNEIDQYLKDWNNNMETNYQTIEDFNEGEEYYQIRFLCHKPKREELLGVSMKAGHDSELVAKYNKLLDLLGEGGILEQFERWMDDEDLEGIIEQIEDNLQENGIKIPYK